MRRNRPAVPLGGQGNDTGGKDERLREHRIGHFWFQARGGCDCGGRTVFAIAFITHDIRIRSACRRNRSRRACGRTGGKADLES